MNKSSQNTTTTTTNNNNCCCSSIIIIIILLSLSPVCTAWCCWSWFFYWVRTMNQGSQALSSVFLLILAVLQIACARSPSSQSMPSLLSSSSQFPTAAPSAPITIGRTFTDVSQFSQFPCQILVFLQLFLLFVSYSDVSRYSNVNQPGVFKPLVFKFHNNVWSSCLLLLSLLLLLLQQKKDNLL